MYQPLRTGLPLNICASRKSPPAKELDRADIDGFAPLVPLLGVEARTALDIPAEERALVAHAEFEAQGPRGSRLRSSISAWGMRVPTSMVSSPMMLPI